MLCVSCKNSAEITVHGDDKEVYCLLCFNKLTGDDNKYITMTDFMKYKNMIIEYLDSQTY
jgi:hypothetical protein